MKTRTWGGAMIISVLWACGGQVEVIDDGADPPGGAGGGDNVGGSGGEEPGPRRCELEAGEIDLVPTRDSPEAACAPNVCTLWFGHGQHLSCPGWGQAGPWTADCSIQECHCADNETGDFVANFATGLVVDARDPDVTCRYIMVPRDEG